MNLGPPHLLADSLLSGVMMKNTLKCGSSFGIRWLVEAGLLGNVREGYIPLHSLLVAL